MKRSPEEGMNQPIMKRIFFDNAATTPLDPAVMAVMQTAMLETFGNASSIHTEGRQARAAVEAARKTVANLLNCSIGEIFFTSGGTEANNMVIKNAVRDLGVRRIISSPIEHHCVLHSVERIAKEQRAQVEWVKVDSEGHIDLGHLEEMLGQNQATDHPTLVSLMHANNEVGTLLPLAAVSQLCQRYGAHFHSDTVQTIGYYSIDLAAQALSFLSGSAHKFHGPKGVGFVYISNENKLSPYLDGGSQERNMRAGTENVYGIVGLAKAMELAYANLATYRAHILQLRDYMAAQLEQQLPDVAFNGDPIQGHYKILSVSFPPTPKTEMLLMNLDMAGISASGGSACSSGIDVGSHVMGQLQPDSRRHTIRFSFNHLNTFAEVDTVVEKLKNIC